MLPDITTLIHRLSQFAVDERLVCFRDSDALLNHLKTLPESSFQEIGRSREGRPLYGVCFGTGAFPVSIIAGSHADEPVGPMTAQALPFILVESFPEFLEYCTFRVVPQMNPDGAERNRECFKSPPDLNSYLRHVVRELPGDDIEFGFAEAAEARPECRAAMAFMRGGLPPLLHASLHGMGYAEGAWFLLCKEWAEAACPLMDAMTSLCSHMGFPLHDIDRKGEKGFTRIRPGFCTTPTAVAMRAHFQAIGDLATASLFQPSSMEFAQSLGGNPLCLVTEVPLFLIHGESTLDDPIYWRFRNAVSEARASGGFESLEYGFNVQAVPIAFQMKLQLAYLLLGIDLAVEANGGLLP